MSKNMEVTLWPPFKRSGTIIKTRIANDDVELDNDLTVNGNIYGTGISAGGIILKETVEIYINGSTGSDTTGDGTALLPFKTIQKGVTETCKYRSNNTMLIHIADATYTEQIVFPASSQGTIKLVGNTTTRDNVIIDAGGSTNKAFDLTNCTALNVEFSSMKIQNATYGIYADNSFIIIDNLDLYDCTYAVWGITSSIVKFTDTTGVTLINGNNRASSYGIFVNNYTILSLSEAVTMSGVSTGIFCNTASRLSLSKIPVITLISGANNYAGCVIRGKSIATIVKGITANGSQIDSDNICLQVNDSTVTITAGSVFTFSNAKYGIQLNGTSVWNEGNTCTWSYTNITTNAYVSHESVNNSINTFGTTPTYYGNFEGSFTQTPGYDYRYPQLAPTLDTTFTFPATKGWILDAATTDHTTSDLITINADIAVEGKAAIKETILGVGDLTAYGNYIDITSGALSSAFKFVAGQRIDLSDNATNASDTIMFGNVVTSKTSNNGSISGWNYYAAFSNSSFGLGFVDLDTLGSISAYTFDIVSKNNTSSLEGFSGTLEQKTVASSGLKFISGKIKPNIAGISNVQFIYADNEGSQIANDFISVADSGSAPIGWNYLINASSATANYGVVLPACTNDAFSSLGGNISTKFGAAQKMTIDASTTTHTDTNGVIDLGFKTATNNSSAINVTSEITATTGITAYGIYNSLTSSAVVTGTQMFYFGNYNQVTKSGADTSTDPINVYASYNTAVYTGSTDAGNRTTYGGYFSATGDTNGSSTAFGIFATASGADANWAGYFEGNVYVNGTVTATGGYGTFPSLSIAPTATGTIIDTALEIEWSTGTIFNADYGSATTQTGNVIGFNVDFNANFVAVADKDVSGYIIKLPALTQSTADTTDYVGFNLATAGALVQDTDAGTINWTGYKVQMPNQTQTTGTVTSNGLDILGGTVTSGTANGINVTMANANDTAIKVTTGKTVLGATTFSSAPTPASNDGAALGAASTGEWSDLFLASGAVINYANSDVTVTHSTNTLTYAGGSYLFDLRAAETIQLVGIYAQNSGNKLSIDTSGNGDSFTNIYSKLRNGTDLGAGKSVYGMYMDIDGNAGDDSTSFMTGIYLTSAGTTGSINNKAIDIRGTWDWAIDTDYSTSPSRFGGAVHTKARYISVNDIGASDLVFTPAYLTGDTGAESNFATWAAVTDGSFRITLDGTAYNVDGIDFTGDLSMADVASTIQTALRTASSTLATVVWSTDHFVITSANTTSTSAITVLETSTGTVGTDISGAGASDWMDADTGNGVVTNAANPTYTLSVSDYLLHVSYTSTGACSIVLPSAQCLAGRTIEIKDGGGNSTSNNIVISTEGSEKIDGQDTFTISTNYDSVKMYSNGSHWFVI